jgi:LTXXQ motif family protein
MLALVAILAAMSEAQARHGGHWRSFGYWGHGLYEGRQLRPPAEEGGTDDAEVFGRSPSRYGALDNRGTPLGAAVAELIKACVDGSEELQHWPNESIAQRIAPDETQRGALEQLRGNAGQQAEILRAACPRDVPADPVARLDVSNSAVDAMLAAVNAVLPAIEGFYATLGDEQKARLVTLSARASSVSKETPRVYRSERRARSAEGTPDQSGMCEQWERVLLDWPRRRIDRDIRLSEAQRVAFSDLIDSSKQAAEVIAKSCPTDTSLTPVGHMQARRKQLETIGQAIQTVRQALGHFYETLDDQQKRRFAATI